MPMLIFNIIIFPKPLTKEDTKPKLNFLGASSIWRGNIVNVVGYYYDILLATRLAHAKVSTQMLGCMPK